MKCKAQDRSLTRISARKLCEKSGEKRGLYKGFGGREEKQRYYCRITKKFKYVLRITSRKNGRVTRSANRRFLSPSDLQACKGSRG
ncbi:hypothetical protein D6764_01105, partial [Candidatus Woesearchaeota archaeon]